MSPAQVSNVSLLPAVMTREPATPPPPQTMIRIGLTEPVMAEFEARAILANTTVEEAISAHVTRTLSYGPDRAPIYLNDQLLSKFRQVLGASRFKDGAGLLDIIRKMASWRVGGYRIELPPAVQEQIAQYARSAGKTPEELGPEIIVGALRERFRV